MPVSFESSEINYLDFPGVVITQSGSEVLSEDNIAKIKNQDNLEYETINGNYINPSIGLVENGSFSWSGASVTRTLSTDVVVVSGNPFVSGVKVQSGYEITGADFGSSKTADYFVVEYGEDFHSMYHPLVDETPPLSIWQSSNNLNWSLIDAMQASEFGWSNSLMYGDFPITTNRYFSIGSIASFQPINTTQAGDRADGVPVLVYLYDTTLSVNHYEMKIDLGNIYEVGVVEIEDLNPRLKINFGLTVQYSLVDNESDYKSPEHTYGCYFYFYEEDKSERSPIDSITTAGINLSTPKNFYLFSNTNDNKLYLYQNDRFYSFDLESREWETLSTNTLTGTNSSVTFNKVDNVFYGCNSSGVFWEYDIYKDSYRYLAPPPSSFTAVDFDGAMLQYCPKNNKLYLGVGKSTNFYCYDLETRTWSTKASTSVGFYFLRGGRCVYSAYDNAIYFVVSSSNTEQQFEKVIRYKIDTNTWENISNLRIISGNSPLELLIDTKRNILHIWQENNFRLYGTYHIETQAWVAYVPNSSRWDSFTWEVPADRDYNQDSRVMYHPYVSICYVESEDRIYSHGENFAGTSDDTDWASHLRYTVPLSYLYSNVYYISNYARYIKISASSFLSYPIRIKRIKVSPLNEQTQSDYTFKYTAGPGVTDEPVEILIANNSSLLSASGVVYIENPELNSFAISQDSESGFSDSPIFFEEVLYPASGISIFSINDVDSINDVVPVGTVKIISIYED